jgi:hypothetical protein
MHKELAKLGTSMLNAFIDSLMKNKITLAEIIMLIIIFLDAFAILVYLFGWPG